MRAPRLLCASRRGVPALARHAEERRGDGRIGNRKPYGHPLDGIARHPWFAVRKKGGRDSWETYEVGGGGGEADPFHHHTPNTLNPQVEKVRRGGRSRASRGGAPSASPAKVKDWIEEQLHLLSGPELEHVRRCRAAQVRAAREPASSTVGRERLARLDRRRRDVSEGTGITGRDARARLQDRAQGRRRGPHHRAVVRDRPVAAGALIAAGLGPAGVRGPMKIGRS